MASLKTFEVLFIFKLHCDCEYAAVSSIFKYTHDLGYM